MKNLFTLITLLLPILTFASRTVAEAVSASEPKLIATTGNHDEIIQNLLGTCKPTGVQYSCDANGDCCSQCCTGGVCLAIEICEGLCIPTALSRVSYCEESDQCCSNCCNDNQCMGEDNCPTGLAIWLIWVLSILGGLLVIVVVVLIIMCVVKRSRDASQKEAIYSSVDQ